MQEADMRNGELEKRIAELERKVQDLEARQIYLQPIIVSPPIQIPAHPFYPPSPYYPTITCQATTGGSLS